MQRVLLLAVLAVYTVVVLAQGPPPPPPVPQPVPAQGPAALGAQCPNDCNNNGVCEQGLCMCYVGYEGRDCSVALPCPNDCNGAGECRNSVCFCYPNYAGDDCSETVDDLGLQIRALVGDAIRGYYLDCLFHNPQQEALDSYINSVMAEKETLSSVRDKICVPIPCPNDCTGHGNCFAGRCECFDDWTGDDCSMQKGICPNQCSLHGQCTPRGQCLCDRGWTGRDCSERDCINKCSGHGRCTNGTCFCDPGYAGADCSRQDESGGTWCPNQCSGQGTCNAQGMCECNYGFSGVDCAQPAMYTLDMNQDSFVTWGPASQFPTSSLTVEFWMKCQSCGPEPALLSYTQGKDSNVLALVNANDLQVAVLNKFTDRRGVQLTDGRWHHVAVTWESRTGQVFLYKDGQMVNQQKLDQTVGKTLPVSGFMVIGQEQDVVSGGFDRKQSFGGLITEYRLWNRVRSGAEIDQQRSIPLRGNEGGLVVYYRFEEDKTNSMPNNLDRMIMDASPNRNNAKMGGNPRFTSDAPPLQPSDSRRPPGSYDNTNNYSNYTNSRDDFSRQGRLQP